MSDYTTFINSEGHMQLTKKGLSILHNYLSTKPLPKDVEELVESAEYKAKVKKYNKLIKEN
jgi:hypothetical protein